jgi:ATP-dependent DNA helicase RecG
MATLARLAQVPVDELSGLAGKRASSLRRSGVATVADLLYQVPRRYVDRSRVEPVALLPVGEEVTVVATVVSVSTRRPRKGLTITECRVTDGTDSLKVVWFNQPFRQRQLAVGDEVALSGKVERFRGVPQMSSPEVDVLSGDGEALRTGRVVPIHPTVADVSPGWMRRAIHNALVRSRPIPDPIPGGIVDRLRLLARDTAFADIHFPESMAAVGPARRRLAFDELFLLELALALAKAHQERTARGAIHTIDGPLVDAFVAGLPYRLTEAQRRVLAEIGSDLARSHPMHRLLQGEVGSGKTAVAIATLLAGIQGGWQVAVMAPTEVLATQHFLAMSDLLGRAGLTPSGATSLGMPSLFAGGGPEVVVVLLTSSQVATNLPEDVPRSTAVEWIADGTAQLVVGTHALIQEGVDFHRLGVAVVDEQHRFGALQRHQLRAKGSEVEPDLLIMTATPIPRTLSMTLYGDLDVSIIDELPPGRSPITTRMIARSQEAEVWETVRTAVAAGRQVYVVCPLVEESTKLELASATAEYERLSGLLPDLRLGLLHGQLPPREKAAVMDAFRAGAIDVLVATTVIEVGIDVPNASIMVIEDADRFGLSQLHQLRGRVGRGSHPGTCLLLADPTTDDGLTRLQAMVETTDGFRLAEVDLELRGQGTVFGARQSGRGDLKVANILRDTDLLAEARREAFALVAKDDRLAAHTDLREEVRVLLGDAVEWLFLS